MTADRHERVIHVLRLLLLGAGLLAALLAWIGAGSYLDDLGEPWNVWDRGYLVMQTFGAQLPALPESGVAYPPALQVARFLAPITLASALAAAALSLFQDTWDRARIWWVGRSRPTAVVAGLGHLGGRVATQLLDPNVAPWHDDEGAAPRRRPAVVAIEQPGALTVPDARRRGILVVEGNARDPLAWRRAGVERAAAVFVACGDDQVTGEAAMACRQVLAEHDHRPDRFLVHLMDRELLLRQRRHQHDSAETDDLAVHTCNQAEVTAARLLAAHPPFGLNPTHSSRLVVAGCDELGKALVVHAARLWSLTPRHRDDGERLDLTLAGPGAAAAVEELRGRVLDLEEVVALTADGGDLHAARSAQRLLHGSNDRLFVCLEDEAAGLAFAVRVVEEHDLDAPIVLQAERAGGTASFVLGNDPRIVPFAPLEVASDPTSLFGDQVEQLARLAHETYLGQVATTEGLDPTRETHQPWAALSEQTKEKNVALVESMQQQWTALGFTNPHEPLAGARIPVPITKDELEALAIAEHDRWCERERANDVTHGPRVPGQPTHPDLVPWDELSEASKRKDRVAVLSWPRGLAGIGLALGDRS